MGLKGDGLRDKMAVSLATAFYLSYIPSTWLGARPGWLQRRRWTGAGLLGTLAGLAAAPLLPQSPWRFGVFWLCAAAAACWLCGRAEKAFGVHDDPRIVIDEVVGFWTAIAFLPPRWPVWLAAAVLFRILDATKPPPCGWLEKLPNGLGVVADDVGAGLLANVAMRILMWLGRC